MAVVVSGEDVRGVTSFTTQAHALQYDESEVLRVEPPIISNDASFCKVSDGESARGSPNMMAMLTITSSSDDHLHQLATKNSSSPN